MVFISHDLLDAPDDVRRYIVGHEYGHIFCKHTVSHLIYWLGFFSFITGYVTGILALSAASLLTLFVVSLLAILPSLAHQREYQADDMAVRLYGQETALNGSLWMANKRNAFSNEFRKSRLRRLGWKK